jgi:hypothetical protein
MLRHAQPPSPLRPGLHESRPDPEQSGRRRSVQHRRQRNRRCAAPPNLDCRPAKRTGAQSRIAVHEDSEGAIKELADRLDGRVPQKLAANRLLTSVSRPASPRAPAAASGQCHRPTPTAGVRSAPRRSVARLKVAIYIIVGIGDKLHSSPARGSGNRPSARHIGRAGGTNIGNAAAGPRHDHSIHAVVCQRDGFG